MALSPLAGAIAVFGLELPWIISAAVSLLAALIVQRSFLNADQLRALSDQEVRPAGWITIIARIANYFDKL